MMDDSHDVKTAASSNNEETDSDRKTPSSNSDAGSLRADTPGPMPKYIYSKKDLMGIAQSPASKRRPAFLQKDFDTSDGYWDPERWTRSFDTKGDGSRGSSPLTFGSSRDRKRSIESERDPYKRRTPADPKARLKEEDEDIGIVLSPQRRSFGTGCHVTTSNKLRPGSPTDADPRDRRDRGGERRIGSGRIQIDRERERDVRDRDMRDRDSRDRDPRERDHRDIRDRDVRDVRDRDHREIRDRDIRDRDMRDRDRDRIDDRRDPRDFRDSRGRFDRDDRRGFDRNDHFRRDDRDFRDRRGDMRDRRYGRYRRQEEEEPEWFSSGPTSQSDTIELRGFEEPKRERERVHEDEYMEDEREEEERHHKKEISEQKGEKRESEAVHVPEQHPQNALPVQTFTDIMQGQQPQGIRSDSPALPFAPDFDFNQIFNIENIPGLSDLPLFGNTEEIDKPSLDASGSKFSRWFQGDSSASAGGMFGNQQDSRRSSINEGEFGYLNDLVGGQKSPSGPSPPPHMMGHHMMQPHLFSQFPRFDMKDAQSAQQQTNILELLHNAKMNAAVSRGQDESMMNNVTDSRSSVQPARPERVGGLMASDLERDLKAMILPGAASQKPRTLGGKNTPPPPMPKLGLGMPGKITTVAELEANLKEMDMSNNNRQQKTMQGGAGHGPSLGITPGMPSSSMPSGQTGHAMPGGLVPNVGPGQALHKTQQRPGTGPQGIPQLPQQPSPTDMTAFNKLLGMMKQAGTLGQAQKEMQKVAGEGRMSPPQQGGPPHQPGQPQQLAAHSNMAHIASNQPQGVPANQINAQQQKDMLQQMLTQQNLQQQIQQQLQQQAKLKQQQQQQQQMQEQILKFVKQNPAIITPKAPASPCPPTLAAVAATLQPPALGNHLQPPASPRCPSPGMPGLLQQPSSSTPNAPSPIMFGSQPPMHLTAPSPIHASQIQPPPSPNTLQVTGQANKQIARVPSPQELVAHTQAIMQNALIKKQLEDQKERFMRKQQDGLKSPNAPVTSGALQFQFPPVSGLTKTAASGTMSQHVVMNSVMSSSGQQPQPKVLPAFTPTSVIRKMANEKAEAKENGREEDGERNTPTRYSLQAIRPGVPQVVLQADTPPHPGTPGSVSSEGGLTINVPSSLQQQLQQLQDPQQQQALINAHMLQQQPQPCMPGQPQPAGGDPKRRPLIGQGTMQGALLSSAPNQQPFVGGRPIVKGGNVMSPPGGTPPVATVQPQPHQPQPTRPLQAGAGAQAIPNMSIAHTSAASQQRAIVGSQASNTVSTSTTAAGSLDINKLLEQQRLQQQQQRISPTSPNMQRQAAAAANPAVLNAQLAAAAAARLPGVQAGIVRPGIPTVNTAVANAAAANAILMQRMMQSGGIQNPVRAGLAPQTVNINQINQLNQLAALQAQAAQPRSAAATIDPRLQATRPGMFPNQLSPMMAAAANQPGLQNSTLSAAALNAAISRALSPQPQMAAPIASLTNMKPDGNNLSKWFGNDLFKQQLPNMPPLPAQGQKVLTVDEIERRSQTVTN